MSTRIYCAAFGCLNSSSNHPEMTFFRLPGRAERRFQWLKLIRRDDLRNKPKFMSYRVCEKHFNVEDVQQTPNRKLLLKNALPLPVLPPTLPGLFQNEDKETQTAPLIGNENYTQTEIATNDMFVQTSASLCSNTPRKRKLRSELLQCRKEIKSLQGHASSSPVPVQQTRAPPSDIPEGKEVILRVYHYLATEYEQLKVVSGNSSELSPLSDIVERTARATGISKHTLAALLDEEKQSQLSVDDGGGATKRRKLHVENYYDCTSPLTEEEESDSPGQDSAPPDDAPGQAAAQQQYEDVTESTLAVKQEIDEDQQELMALFFKEEHEAERDPLHNESTSTVTAVTCTTHTEVKTEPPDDVTTQMYSTDVSDATLKIEPADSQIY